MGNTLGNIFHGAYGTAASPADPTTGTAATPADINPWQKMAGAATKGALQGAGRGMQQQPMPGGGGMMPAPAATPVDPSYFSPTPQQPGIGANPNFYGGR